MSQNNSWKEVFDNEINQAIEARNAGNEGRARVCARRAAGIVIREYLQRQEIPLKSPSSYEHAKYLLTLPDISPRTKEIAEHLILRVNPDHNLPIKVDLIAEAKALKDMLLFRDSS